MKTLFEALSEDAQTLGLWIIGIGEALTEMNEQKQDYYITKHEAIFYHVLPTWARVKLAFAELIDGGWLVESESPYHPKTNFYSLA